MRSNIIRAKKRSAVLGIMGLLVISLAFNEAYALGGYWKPIGDKPYTVTFIDESKNAVLGEFKKTVRWKWDEKGKVTVTEWDDQATFIFKDKGEKEHKIPNDAVKKRVLDLALGFTGKLQGNITELVKSQEVKGIILEDIKPTLTGYTNTAFVETDKVGEEKKEMTVFRRNKDASGPLVTAKGGYFWGDEVAFEIGRQGEKKLSGDAHVAIDGDTQS